MVAKRVGKYGMAHHTIKYWQDQAKALYRYDSIYHGRAIVENPERHTGRDLGHAIIAFASVASREHIIASLTRTRRGRWLL